MKDRSSMKNIKMSLYFSLIILVHSFCGCVYAQKDESQLQNKADQNEPHDAQDQQGIAHEKTEKLERLKKHYEALNLTQDADLDKVTRAYHNLAAQAHEKIQFQKSNKKIYYDNKHVVNIYYVRYMNNNQSFTQDRLDYGYDYIECADANRDEVIATKEQLIKIRAAYEAISGHKLKKIKKTKVELSTKGLDQNALNNEMRPFTERGLNSPQYFPGFLHIIQEKRKQAGLNFEQDLDEDDFVLGESNQDMSWLSEEDKVKARAHITTSYLSKENEIKAKIYQVYLEKIAQEQKPQSDQLLAEQGWYLALACGPLAIIFLVARAIMLHE